MRAFEVRKRRDALDVAVDVGPIHLAEAGLAPRGGGSVERSVRGPDDAGVRILAVDRRERVYARQGRGRRLVTEQGSVVGGSAEGARADEDAGRRFEQGRDRRRGLRRDQPMQHRERAERIDAEHRSRAARPGAGRGSVEKAVRSERQASDGIKPVGVGDEVVEVRDAAVGFEAIDDAPVGRAARARHAVEKAVRSGRQARIRGGAGGPRERINDGEASDQITGEDRAGEARPLRGRRAVEQSQVLHELAHGERALGRVEVMERRDAAEAIEPVEGASAEGSSPRCRSVVLPVGRRDDSPSRFLAVDSGEGMELDVGESSEAVGDEPEDRAHAESSSAFSRPEDRAVRSLDELTRRISGGTGQYVDDFVGLRSKESGEEPESGPGREAKRERTRASTVHLYNSEFARMLSHCARLDRLGKTPGAPCGRHDALEEGAF